MKVFIDSPLFIYLNTVSDLRYRVVYEDFYIDILNRYKAYTDILVLDELIYISKKKYGIPYKLSLEFIRSNILPFIHICSLGEKEYSYMSDLLSRYNIKPSDAIHLASMISNNIKLIVTEDIEFDRVDGVERIWIDRS